MQRVDMTDDGTSSRVCRVARFGLAEVVGLAGVALLCEGGRRIFEPLAWILGGAALLTIAILDTRRARNGG